MSSDLYTLTQAVAYAGILLSFCLIPFTVWGFINLFNAMHNAART